MEAEHDSESQQMLADFQVRLRLIKKGIEKRRRSEWSVARIYSRLILKCDRSIVMCLLGLFI